MAPARKPEYTRGGPSQRQRGPAPIPAPIPALVSALVPVPAQAPHPLPQSRGDRPKLEDSSPTPTPTLTPSSRIAFTPMDIDTTPSASSSTRIFIDLTLDESHDPVIQCHRVAAPGPSSSSSPAASPAPTMSDLLRRLSRVEEGQQNHEEAFGDVFHSLDALATRNDTSEARNLQRHNEVIRHLTTQTTALTTLTSRIDRDQRHHQRLYDILEGGMQTVFTNMGWQPAYATTTPPSRPPVPPARPVRPTVTRSFSTGTAPRPAYDPHPNRDARGRRWKMRHRDRSRTPANGSGADSRTASRASTVAATPGSSAPGSPRETVGAPVFPAVGRGHAVTGVGGAEAPRYGSGFFPPSPPLRGNGDGGREGSDDGSWVDESGPVRPSGRRGIPGGLWRGER